MRFYARHGVLPQERTVGGEYAVSLRMQCQVDRAMTSDNVADTIDYGQAAEIVRHEMMQPSQLLERVAYRIAEKLLQSFSQMSAVTVKVSKLTPPLGLDCDGASVEITVRR